MKDYIKVVLLFLAIFLFVGFLASPFDDEARAERKAEREAEIEAAYDEGYSDGYQACMDDYGIPED